MRPWTRKSASIQPRTSLRKSDCVVAGGRLRGPRAPRREAAAAQSAFNTITLSEARSRLDQRRFSRPNTHFLAFFKIYKKIFLSRANLAIFCPPKIVKICKIFEKFSKTLQFFLQICLRGSDFLVDLEKCEKMRIWTRKSASIQKRTSPPKVFNFI